MTHRIWQLCLAALAGGAALVAGAASALAETPGQPWDWGMPFQLPATVLAEQVVWFEQYTLAIITAITLFVLALLVAVMIRFNGRRNPEPSKTSHNTLVEVVWTVVPVLILVMIAFPSFRLLFQQTTIPEPDMTVKAIGAQWYWGYEYMDEGLGDIEIISYMLNDEERAERKAEWGLTEREVPRNLAVDYPLVVPAGSTVQVLVTSNDVNHAWGMPSFGIKKDAIQGRLNETWFRVDEPGTYFGQCYELCGRSHAFMPVEGRVLEPERFQEWAATATESLSDANELLLTWQQQEVAGGEAVASLEVAD